MPVFEKNETAGREKGFTLVELMVGMVVSSILLAGIYGVYKDQLRTAVTLQRVVEMNQNLRVAGLIMGRDIRMAGIDPSGDAGAGIVIAERDKLRISMDYINKDWDSVKKEWEQNWYDGGLSSSGEIVELDLNNGNLRRWVNAKNESAPKTTVGTTRHIARNIDALDFVYLDEDGAVLNDPSSGKVNDADLDKIRCVQLTLIARAGDAVPVLARTHTDRTIYYNPQGMVLLDKSTSPDNFRRQMISLTLNCRNMGV